MNLRDAVDEVRRGLHGLPKLRAFGGLGVVGLSLNDVGGPIRRDGNPVLALEEERLGENPMGPRRSKP